MAKTLIYADGSPTSVKISDTDTNLYLKLAKDNVAVDLSTAKSIDVKIADSNKNYLKDISINPADLPNASKGVLILPLNSTNIAGLPAGSYAFEVWIETADSNQEIYPDVDVKMFTIFSNIVGGTTVMAQLTLQQFADRITDMESDLQSKVNSGYFKGDKGDKGDTGATGTVDNAGLTNAPAFQALQTQVNNSAVGANLLTGTKAFSGNWNNIGNWDSSDNWVDPNGNTAFKRTSAWNGLSQPYVVSKGKTYTFSAYYDWTSGDSAYFYPNSNVSGAAQVAQLSGPDMHMSNAWELFTYTFTAVADGEFWGRFELNGDGTLHVGSYKLERGSNATPWCPNPSEILTQSDYAKIKAAIVALGGSLS
ncbi:MAG: collagen-like protein [Liquorilactobacillus nagelii]|uniref:collagen-like protein n=1 Tax=Oenococcus sicerae TaxID=2203724 RepID=UPI0039ED80D2